MFGTGVPGPQVAGREVRVPQPRPAVHVLHAAAADLLLSDRIFAARIYVLPVSNQ